MHGTKRVGRAGNVSIRDDEGANEGEEMRCVLDSRGGDRGRARRDDRSRWMDEDDGIRSRVSTLTGTHVFAQNRRNTSQRLELMKYNPYMKKHTLHRELKK